LGDITEFVLDGTHGSPIRTENGIPVLSAQNVVEGRLSYGTDRYTSPDEYRAFAKRVAIQPGDLLLTIVGTIGRAAIVDEVLPAVFQRSVSIIRPSKDRIDPRYMLHVTQSAQFKRQLVSATNGSTQGGVYLGKLKEILLPTPPLDEQRRIASILDQAGVMRHKRREALFALDRLAEATFVEMFGDPRGVFCNLPRRTLVSVAKVSTGATPPSSSQGMFDGPVPFVTPGDLDHEMPVRRTLTEAGASAVRTVRAGSTLVCCIGAIGKMGLARARSAFNQQINAVEWGGEVEDIYGYLTLRFFKRNIAEWGASTTLPILKKSSFEKIEIPIAPLERQREFVRLVKSYDALAVPVRAQATAFDGLFASLQHRAFAGEL
jgi:type I restriction enzyme S subunit